MDNDQHGVAYISLADENIDNKALSSLCTAKIIAEGIFFDTADCLTTAFTEDMREIRFTPMAWNIITRNGDIVDRLRTKHRMVEIMGPDQLGAAFRRDFNETAEAAKYSRERKTPRVYMSDTFIADGKGGVTRVPRDPAVQEAFNIGKGLNESLGGGTHEMYEALERWERTGEVTCDLWVGARGPVLDHLGRPQKAPRYGSWEELRQEADHINAELDGDLDVPGDEELLKDQLSEAAIHAIVLGKFEDAQAILDVLKRQ